MKNVSGKERLFAILMCVALVLPFAPLGAQDADNFWSDQAPSDKNNSESAETAAPKAAAETAAPKAAVETAEPQATPQAKPQAAPKNDGKSTPKLPQINSAKTVNNTFNKIVGYLSQIGAIFGKTTGIRIGGTSVSAIVMLVVAKMIQDRGPPWLRWVLYLSGGTMVAGSGANIMQSLMRLF